MNQSNTSDFQRSNSPEVNKDPSCVLYVCTSCRGRGMSYDVKEQRPGFILYQKLQDTFNESPLHKQVEVRPAQCLSVCPRPCGIALTKSGSWTYLFGDQQPNNNVDEIVECVSVYLGASKGFMPREHRLQSLRKSILGRIPPFGER